MENLKFIPTHYYLGLIPCITVDFVPNTCRSIEFDDNIIELWGIDHLNELNKELHKYWYKPTVIPIDQLDEFLTAMEELK